MNVYPFGDGSGLILSSGFIAGAMVSVMQVVVHRPQHGGRDREYHPDMG
jgi:hypothetical protein